MKRNKVLNWVLFLAMALTVFCIPVGGYATDGDGAIEFIEGEGGGTAATYTYSLKYYSDNSEFIQINDGDEIDYSRFLDYWGPFCSYCVDQDGAQANVDTTMTIDIGDSKTFALLYNDGEGNYLKTAAGEIAVTSDFDYALLPRKTGTGDVTVKVFNNNAPDTPVLTVKFKVVVAQESLTNYCFASSKYDEVTGDNTITPIQNGAMLDYSDIGKTTPFMIYNKDYGDWDFYQEGSMSIDLGDSGCLRMYYSNGTETNLLATKGVTTPAKGTEVVFFPRKPGVANVKVSIYDELDQTEPAQVVSFSVNVPDSEFPDYQFGYYDAENAKYIPFNTDTIGISELGSYYSNHDFLILENKDSGLQLGGWNKLVVNNSDPSIAKLCYQTAEGKWVESTESELTFTDCPTLALKPQKAGNVTISANMYDEDRESEPLVTKKLTVQISQEFMQQYDTKRYGDYVQGASVSLADYDTQTLSGSLRYSSDFPELEAADFNKLTITATVNEKNYSATVNTAKSTFSAKLPKVAPGTKVKVTYEMGAYTRVQNVIVMRKITPTITAKNFEYDGKFHKPTVTVKFGDTTLVEGKDYTLTGNSRKAVGRTKYKVTRIKGTRYIFSTSTHYFKVNPTGTVIISLTPKTNKMRLKWRKQETKMSTERITGYQIQLSTNKNFTTGTTKLITVKGYKKVSKTLAVIKARKTHYVRVRTYRKINKLYYYSGWTAIKGVMPK